MPITVSANQMIARALVDLRVLGIGRSVTKAHTDVAFPYLREIVDSWQMNRWAVFRVDRTRFALIAGTSEYTLGPGGTLLVKDTPNSVATEPLSFKPHWLTSAKSNQPGEDFEYPVTIWTRRRWLDERQKGLDDERPRAIYYGSGHHQQHSPSVACAGVASVRSDSRHARDVLRVRGSSTRNTPSRRATTTRSAPGSATRSACHWGSRPRR